MHTIRFVSFLILVFISCNLFAQQKSIKFDNYSIEEGLSQSSVTSIVQDKFGIIWIATQDGLNKFDGYTFEIYKNEPLDDRSIPNNYVHCLKVDPKGAIWFGTNRGMGVMNPLNMLNVRVNRDNVPDLRGYIFTHIGFDAGQNIWALSEKHGINIIDPHSKKVQIISSIHGNSGFTSLYSDHEQTIWVGTKSGQIYYAPVPYDSFKEIDYNGVFTIAQVNQMTESNNGIIYVSTEAGVFYINKERQLLPLTKDKRLRYNRINCAYPESKDRVWVGTAENGLFLVKKDSLGKERLVQYRKNPYDNSSLHDDNISYIFEDNCGIFWIGTEKGISKFDKYKQGFTTVSLNTNPKRGLIDHNVWSFAEDQEKNIYIGTKKALSIYSYKTGEFTHIQRPDQSQHNLLSIYVANPDTLWLGFDDGLYVLTINDLQKKQYNFKRIDFMENANSANTRVYQIVEADQNRLWIGSRAGLSIINKKTFEYQFYSSDDSHGLGDGSVKVVFRDSKGKIWLVTSNEGLYNMTERSDSTFYFKPHEIKGHSQSNSQITSIAETENNTLWLGTYGEGIKKLELNSGEVTIYNESDGLSNNVIYGILVDQKGNIWASTNKGISKFNPTTEQFTTYSVRDGLQSNEFNTNAYLKSSDNLLYFGGINGYNVFDPSEIRMNPNPPGVVITSVQLSLKGTQSKNTIANNVVHKKRIELEYNENDISFEFAATNFSNTSENSYKYILEGHDEEFSYMENENRINYMNIPHGTYTFKVYAKSSDGIWSPEPTIIELVITPPFWLTWWFRIAAIVVLTVIGLIIYRRRIDKIRRQKVRLEIEVVKRTRQVTEQSKKLEEQKKKVEIQKAKIEHQKELLEKEKEKVESLLLNVLPEGTAEELKNKGRAKARYYRNVSVLFTDFVGFSKIAEGLKPQQLVQQLDDYFSTFDEIIEKYDLEKIKTIGDSYMCAGGVPIRNKSNAIEVVLAAIEIREYMNKRQEQDPNAWNIRIGINTGEVIAGVIGIKRFAYDIWGATVNQAQRMEQHGQPGTVNVSGNTYEYIAPYFDCSYRGKIQTKHKGMLDMYNVKGIKAELSIDGLGIEPNSKFWKIVDLHLYSSINYMKAERHIMKLLEDRLSPKLLYHSINHTIDVTEAVERIAIMEGITDEDLFLLKSAATYHDAGFIEKYEKNEEIGMRLAREILPKYGYTEEQIDIIDGLIQSTEIPQSPVTHLQQIMCDADLDYLGRDDFHEIADLLRRELREHGKLNSDRMWDEIQVKFLEQHTYFTDSAIRLRREKKLKHIEEIKERLKTHNYKD